MQLVSVNTIFGFSFDKRQHYLEKTEDLLAKRIYKKYILCQNSFNISFWIIYKNIESSQLTMLLCTTLLENWSSLQWLAYKNN